MEQRRARDIWRQFFLLTQEMKKFISEDDVDMFLELARQRDIVFGWLQDLASDDFRHTPEGEALLAELKPLDLEMQQAAQRWLNQSRRRSASVQAYTKAYDFTEDAALNSRLNKKF